MFGQIFPSNFMTPKHETSKKTAGLVTNILDRKTSKTAGSVTNILDRTRATVKTAAFSRSRSKLGSMCKPMRVQGRVYVHMTVSTSRSFL